MSRKKHRYANRDNNAYKDAGKMGGTPSQMSKNYYRAKDGEELVDYNTGNSFLKENVLWILKGLGYIIGSPFILLYLIIKGIVKIFILNKNKATKNGYRNRIKGFKTKPRITTTLTLRKHIKQIVKQVASEILVFTAKIVINETILKTYNTIMVTVKTGVLIFSLINVYDKAVEVIEMFEEHDGSFKCYKDEFQGIVELIKSSKDVTDNIKEIDSYTKRL